MDGDGTGRYVDVGTPDGVDTEADGRSRADLLVFWN